MSINTTIQCGAKLLVLDRPRVMGILNVTPDSFSDGGRFQNLDDALRRAEAMVADGADIIDVGGESTRPGAAEVSVQLEVDRVVPVVEAITTRMDVIVSVDTSKAQVMCEAVASGAGIINDVRALREPDSLNVAAQAGVPVCLMHMQGQPRSMQSDPQYDDVVSEVIEFLLKRRQACINAGISASQIILDPGFGFGKNLKHNLLLLKHLNRLCDEAITMIGLSRKRMFAEIFQDADVSRVVGSVSAALLCVERGASIVRVHDVEQTVQALSVYQAVVNCQSE